MRLPSDMSLFYIKHLSLYVHILGGVGKKFTTMLVIVFGK